MTETYVKNCWDKMTKKCYLILKQIYWKEYALESIKSAPIFITN